MKHVLRSPVLARLRPRSRRASGRRHRRSAISAATRSTTSPLTWDAGGVAESTWHIPQEAKLGTYEVYARARQGRPAPSGNRGRVPSAGVSCSADAARSCAPLRPAGCRDRVAARPQRAVPRRRRRAGLPVMLRWQTHRPGGGGARGLRGVHVRQRRGHGRHRTPRHGGRLRTKRRRVEAERRRDQPARTPQTSTSARPSCSTPRARRERLFAGLPIADKLAGGRHGARVPRPERRPRRPSPRDVRSGQSSWLVGLKPDSWMTSRDRLKTQVAVVDVRGRAVAGCGGGGRRLRAQGLLESQAAGRRLLRLRARRGDPPRRPALPPAGTDAKGLLLLRRQAAPRSGNLVLQAPRRSIRRAAAARATRRCGFAGDRDWWFKVNDCDRIDLVPEKRRYEPGETARLQVRMPFREATALVTVEREGVLEAALRGARRARSP